MAKVRSVYVHPTSIHLTANLIIQLDYQFGRHYSLHILSAYLFSLEIMEYIFDIDISRADGCSQQCLLSSSSDNCLRVYDAESLEIVSTISAHKKTINNIEFSRVSPFLLYSCSSDHSLCLWDTRSPTTACFSIKVLSLNISRNKVHLLCINIIPSPNICD